METNAKSENHFDLRKLVCTGKREDAMVDVAPRRPVKGESVYVLVPRPGSFTVIASGSGMVGYPIPLSQESAAAGDKPRMMVYYEGNLFGAENMRMWVDKVRHAMGRMVEKYPTVAMSAIPEEDLIVVGFTDGDAVEVSNGGPLADWLATTPGSEPTEVISRRPERYDPRSMRHRPR